ncbi:hypothetical protein ACFL4S_00290 [bacterium]
MIENLLKQKESVLVIGGFHGQGVTELLRNQGYGYNVFIPALDKYTQSSNYFNRLKTEIRKKENIDTAAFSTIFSYGEKYACFDSKTYSSLCQNFYTALQEINNKDLLDLENYFLNKIKPFQYFTDYKKYNYSLKSNEVKAIDTTQNHILVLAGKNLGNIFLKLSKFFKDADAESIDYKMQESYSIKLAKTDEGVYVVKIEGQTQYHTTKRLTEIYNNMDEPQSRSESSLGFENPIENSGKSSKGFWEKTKLFLLKHKKKLLVSGGIIAGAVLVTGLIITGIAVAAAAVKENQPKPIPIPVPQPKYVFKNPQIEGMCTFLENDLDLEQNILPPSYPEESFPLNKKTFSYDAHLSTLALAICQNPGSNTTYVQQALDILDFIENTAQRHPAREFTYTAYYADTLTPAEFFDDTGQFAWSGLSALAFGNYSLAMDTADKLISQMDGEGGILGRSGQPWYSSEHNFVAYMLFKRLAGITGNQSYINAENMSKAWLTTYAFDTGSNLFNRGKSDTTTAADVYTMAGLTMTQEEIADTGMNYQQALNNLASKTLVTDNFNGKQVTGADFTEAGLFGRNDTVSIEWTAQLCAVMNKTDLRIISPYYYDYILCMQNINKTLITPQIRGLAHPYATQHSVLTFSDGWLTAKGPSLAATIWRIFAELGINPMNTTIDEIQGIAFDIIYENSITSGSVRTLSPSTFVYIITVLLPIIMQYSGNLPDWLYIPMPEHVVKALNSYNSENNHPILETKKLNEPDIMSSWKKQGVDYILYTLLPLSLYNPTTLNKMLSQYTVNKGWIIFYAVLALITGKNEIKAQKDFEDMNKFIKRKKDSELIIFLKDKIKQPHKWETSLFRAVKQFAGINKLITTLKYSADKLLDSNDIKLRELGAVLSAA